ncbi:hypothetical protein [Klebsiella pneumoniae]|uniref:hypothetical protein n=1 Tax=Klebsiella pneumoniae TaxID=573 RepID=UPI001E4174BB|nr:hypothetical protein [Klebsiella pneumoniae]
MNTVFTVDHLTVLSVLLIHQQRIGRTRVDVMKKQGRIVTVSVNGSVLDSIDTYKAVAADYISFIQAVTQALTHTESLEREANASGKTIKHAGFGSLGSVDITEAKGP